MDLLTRDIRLFGNVAVVSSVFRITWIFRETKFGGAYHFLKIWVYTKTTGLQVVSGGMRELVGR